MRETLAHTFFMLSIKYQLLLAVCRIGSNKVIVQTIRRKDSVRVSQTSMEKWLAKISPQIGYYLAGFADGEGSFNVSLKKRADHTLGWQIKMTFNVSQRDKTVLTLFKRHLGCGNLWQRQDGVWYYSVYNPRAIQERVTPFFNRFGFLSSVKKTNFSIFKKISTLMLNNEHLTSEGLLQIIKLREMLNEGRGRKRKYTINNYQESLTENPQRLYVRVNPRQKRPWE